MPNLSRRAVVAATAATSVAAARGALADEPAPSSASRSNPGPRDPALAGLNPSAFTPPPTDHGDLPAFKYPFSVEHTRVQDGGWARQVTVKDFPIAKSLAGVNMRLTAGGVRELHWHQPAEWSYMLAGRARITAVDQQGRHFVADVGVGDLWNFASGIPHSIQGLGPDGCEFLLVFDDGAFSEFDTFLLSDWFAHTPKDVLAKNFGVAASAFAQIPSKELYIFQASEPPALSDDAGQSHNAAVPIPYNFSLTGQPPIKAGGGTLRIADSRNFPASSTIAAALVEIAPGGMREMHWHPNADEWQYYIAGHGRMTVFGSGARARTADFAPGDVGYVERSRGHYIENTGSDVLRYLEMFRSDRYEDVSLAQWLANTPKELVQQHLHLADGLLDRLSQEKQFIVAAS